MLITPRGKRLKVCFFLLLRAMNDGEQYIGVGNFSFHF